MATRQAQRVAATRERLLQGAIASFEEVGFEATNAREITRRAGVSYGLFYHYFPTKEDAFAEVVATVQDRILDESRARLSDDRFESLVGQLTGFMIAFRDHPGIMRSLVEGLVQSDEVEALWRKIRKDAVSRIEHRITREQEAGLVRVLPNRRLAAEALASMAEWFAFTQFVLDPAGAPDDELFETTVRTVAELWYAAIYGKLDRAQRTHLRTTSRSVRTPAHSTAADVTDRFAGLNTRQRQAAETREHLLAAAASVFGELGYQAVSVNAITERAATSHGTFYVYFDNVEDIFTQVMLQLFSDMRAAAPATDEHDFDSLVSQVHGFLEAFAFRPALMRALLEAIMVNPVIHAAWHESHLQNIRDIAIRIRQDQADGIAARVVDAERVAPAVAAMAEWYAFTQFSIRRRKTRVTPAAIGAAAEVLADLSYHAAYAALPDRLAP
jgi:AcrR family transcriptional regulator